MKSIILAAGEGTRLRPYTNSRPKCLVEVDGKSLLDRQLEILKSAGVSDNVVVGGYLADQLKDKGSRFYLNPRYDETNMVWTLFCAEEELDSELIVTYGDIVYSKDVLKSLLKSDADISLTIDLDWQQYWEDRLEDPLDDAETLKLDDDGMILELGQKPKSLNEIEGQYMGLMKFSLKGLRVLKEIFYRGKKDGKIGSKPVENAYMTDLLQAIINYGTKIQSVPVHGGWIEIDTVDDLESDVTLSRLEKISQS
jgi:choline kinase